MSFRPLHLLALALCAVLPPLGAQVPVAFGALEAPARLSPEVRTAIAGKAAGYPFVGFTRFDRDSVLLVFEDSELTGEAIRAHTWMFGPPVTPAEADSCPPEKVLGRRIARAFWKASGQPEETQAIMIAVRGTRGADSWTSETMYYWRPQLTAPWAGDPPRVR